MKTFLNRLTKILVVALFVFAASLSFAETGSATPEVDLNANLTNYDSKLRISKIVINSIQEDKKAGRPISLIRIKDQLMNKPVLAQVAIEQGMEQFGNVFQFGLAGSCPPYGIIAGTIIGGVMGSFGGAIGYETSAAMENGQELDAREMLGKALYNIDLPCFVGKNIGSMAGAVIGQALIPVPFLGAVIGGIVGGVVGGLATNQLRKIAPIGRLFDSVQEQWRKVGTSVLDWAARKKAASASSSAHLSPTPEIPAASSVQAPAGISPPSLSSGSVPVQSPGTVSAGCEIAYAEYQALYNRYSELVKTGGVSSDEVMETGKKLQAAKTRFLELKGATGK
ncbi:MAG: hypothetical protein WA705_02990 [Candidatus Ozemobacteraceae bacterium]